jgi:hypothetical protein
MVNHRSMRGKTIDMVALMGANPDTVAVTGGGQSMNARGDILGPGGKVVKRIEQIQEEYNKLNPGNRQKISVADTEKMKKFALKKRFMTPEEIQKNLAEIEAEKKKAKKLAEKILTTTEMMAQQGPVIVDNSKALADESEVLKFEEDNTESKKPRGKRVIEDNDE